MKQPLHGQSFRRWSFHLLQQSESGGPRPHVASGLYAGDQTEELLRVHEYKSTHVDLAKCRLTLFTVAPAQPDRALSKTFYLKCLQGKPPLGLHRLHLKLQNVRMGKRRVSRATLATENLMWVRRHSLTSANRQDRAS